jgi:hypothetical protein
LKSALSTALGLLPDATFELSTRMVFEPLRAVAIPGVPEPRKSPEVTEIGLAPKTDCVEHDAKIPAALPEQIVTVSEL